MDSMDLSNPIDQTSDTPDKNRLFPVFLKLEQLQVLVIGGGPVAHEKLQTILANSPNTMVTLVAETIVEEIRELAAQHPHLSLREKTFEENDLQGMEVAIVAVNNQPLSASIYQLAKNHQILVNVADTPDLCDFYLSSVVQKGNVKIAISTNGKSPSLAKRLKEKLQHELPAELDDLAINWVNFATRWMEILNKKYKD